MPPRTKDKGESKQGLIITLVFFILATLGLGVSTYYGFADQDKLEKAAKDAKTSETAFKSERDWYKFQTMMLYSYIGKTDGMEGVDTLGIQRKQFNDGSMKAGKDKEFVTKTLKDLDKQLGWNDGNQPNETLEGLLVKANTAKDGDANRIAKLEQRLKDEQKKVEDRDAELKALDQDYKDKLADLRKTLKNDFVKSDKDLVDLRNEFKTLSEKHTNALEKANEANKDLQKQLSKKDEDIKHLKARSKDQQNRLDEYAVKSEQAPASMRTDWKIIYMDRRGLNPYINLGSADHVKPQLTFTIHGIGADGRPNPRPKGTLEVINVIEPHVSQTRVTSVKDRNRDPITRGDVIYNASWNPNLKKHVAIAGLIDLTGDGHDNFFEFMRSLRRQNIVVDAYLDPKDGTMKGKVTFRTDFLILGDTPELVRAGKMSELGEKILSGQNLMQAEAKKYNVPMKNLVSYLEMIGYRLPHSTSEAKSSLYNPDLRPDQAPRLGGDRVPPAIRPDK